MVLPPIQDFISKHFVSELGPPAIILGENENVNKITLLVLGYGKKHWNLSSSFPLLHYKIRYCIKGVHLLSKEDSVFNEIEVELQSLTHWMNSYPVRLSIPIKDGKLTTDFTLSYSRVENNLLFDVNDGFALSMNAWATYTDIYREEIIVRQRYIASIKSPEVTDFFTLLDKCHRLQSFLNMATLSHNHFLALRLYSEPHFQELENNEKIPRTIEIFFNQLNKEDINGKSTKGKRYLFTYEDVKNVFPELIKKWFAFDSKMIPILRHLIDSIQQKPVFKSADFLIVIQALEGYHHRFFDLEPKKERKLIYRLKNLINAFSKDVLAARGIDIQCTVDSRNYYSHFYNRTANMQIADGVDLYHLTIKLRNLLICCFLHELGLCNQKINEILEKYAKTL